MKMRFFILMLIMISFVFTASAQNGKNYQVLVPTGKSKNNLPVLTYLPQNDTRYGKDTFVFEKTFITNTVQLYRMIQQYMVNKGLKKEVEPAYLLLSNRQGGFPMQGFYLERNDSLIDRYKTYYIDLQDIDKDFGKINSMTQVFPHEMAHVFFGMMAPDVQNEYQNNSSDIHYFSVVTNYLTAFNEGFAEHFENASRLNEPDAGVKKGIEKHTSDLKKLLPYRIARLDRDFRFPLRLGYYRAGMLVWYQRFEDFKRYQWALNGDFTHGNRLLSSGNAEKAIQYRNIGLAMDGIEKRNPAQISSNEGIINAFFTRLMLSSIKDNYQPASFYYPFLKADDTTGFNPQTLSSLQNHFLKIFYVFNMRMNHHAGDTSMLNLFILSYGKQFPQEKEQVEKIYSQVTGLHFDPSLVPEIWVMNSDHPHNFILLDQYGGNKMPYYTFNINTAGKDDFLTFSDISEKDAEAIIAWRDQHGGYKSIDELSSVPGLDKNAAVLLISAHKLLKNKNESKKPDVETGINIFNIFLYNGGHILLMGLIWFVIFILIFFFVFLYRKYPVKTVIVISVQKFLKLYLLILIGLACMVFSHSPVLYFLGLAVLLLVIDFIKTRKSSQKRREVIFTTVLMGMIVLYSLI